MCGGPEVEKRPAWPECGDGRFREVGRAMGVMQVFRFFQGHWESC